MSKRKKRYRKIREQPHKVRFEQIRVFLVHDLGFEIINKSGSHVIFVHNEYKDEQGRPLRITIVRPHGRKDLFVGRGSVIKTLNVLDEYGILIDYGLEDDS